MKFSILLFFGLLSSPFSLSIICLSLLIIWIDQNWLNLTCFRWVMFLFPLYFMFRWRIYRHGSGYQDGPEAVGCKSKELFGQRIWSIKLYKQWWFWWYLRPHEECSGPHTKGLLSRWVKKVEKLQCLGEKRIKYKGRGEEKRDGSLVLVERSGEKRSEETKRDETERRWDVVCIWW